MTDFYFSENNLRKYATVCLLCVHDAYANKKAMWKKMQVESKKAEKKIEEIEKQETHEIRAEKKLAEKKIRMEARSVERASRYYGRIYLLVSENGLCKIGRSKDVASRLSGLNREIPIKVDLIHSVLSNDTPKSEIFMHKKFAKERVKYEWFKLSDSQMQWIRSLKDFGIDKLMADGL